MGDEVTTTEGGAGDGEAFRGGVCARAGDTGCGTGNGFSFLACFSCLSLFFGSLSGEAVPDAEAALFLSPLSFLCRLSYTQVNSGLVRPPEAASQNTYHFHFEAVHDDNASASTNNCCWERNGIRGRLFPNISRVSMRFQDSNSNVDRKKVGVDPHKPNGL